VSPEDFPFRFPPFKHQWREFVDHRDDPGRALLWQMRTGKTKAMVDLGCYRHSIRKDVDGMLVFAPNGVHVNWVRRELPAHAWPTVDLKAHAWVSSESHKPSHEASLAAVLGHRGLAVLTVNSESVIMPRVQEVIKRFIKGRRILLVIDESHDFRTPGSKRSKYMRALAKRCQVRRILSGTSVENSPLAAWAQYELVEPGALGHPTFGEFKAKHAFFVQERTRGGRLITVLKEYRELPALRRQLSRWSSVVLREDCEGLPPLMLTERTVLITDEQHKAYRTLMKEMLLELEHGAEVEAIEGGARLIKLQQIISGFVVDRDGRLHDVVPDEHNPRLAAMEEQVDGTDGKVIVWCQYREDIRKVLRRLREREENPLKVVEYHGAIHSQAQRQAAIDAFQGDPAVKVFVGQPRAGGVGLNLSAASAMVWYSHTFDAIVRAQALERATKVGGKSTAVVDLVVPGTVDGYILSLLKQKKDVASEVAGAGLRDVLAKLREMLG
jgi:SNF2 family DNA or RNA helicase